MKEDRLIAAMKARNDAIKPVETSQPSDFYETQANNVEATTVDNVDTNQSVVVEGVVSSAVAEVMDTKVLPLKLSVDTVASIPAKEDPTNTSIAMKDDEFMSIATEVIGDAFLNLLRDMVRPPVVEDERSVGSSVRNSLV